MPGIFPAEVPLLIISVPKEITPGETRVATVPEVVGKLVKLGYTVQVQAGAGEASSIADSEFEQEGAKIIQDAAELYSSADLLLSVQPPADHPGAGKHELDMLKEGATFIGFFYSLYNFKMAGKAAGKKVNILSMDAVPRITKAQRMDALSSQTNIGGYRAVMLAAERLPKIFPLMMTAAGTIAPAKVVIMGAGVAGLQAIATAKRLGAVVDVSDVRPAVKEQVESLGAKFIEVETEENMEDEGGYAKEASAEYLKKQQEVVRKHIVDADAVITTALVPGKKAPVLVTADMVKDMRTGSVVVDMAAGYGGNCELSEPDQTVVKEGVIIVGETNLPAQAPVNASDLYARNLLSLLQYLAKIKEGELFALDLEDEIVKGALIVKDGEVIHGPTKELLG